MESIPPTRVPHTRVSVTITYSDGDRSTQDFTLQDEDSFGLAVRRTAENRYMLYHLGRDVIENQQNSGQTSQMNPQTQTTSGANANSNPLVNHAPSFPSHPPGFDPKPMYMPSTRTTINEGANANRNPLPPHQTDQEGPQSVIVIDDSLNGQKGGQVVTGQTGDASRRKRRGRPARSEPRQQPPRKGPPYICERCGQVFEVSTMKAAHMKKHYDREDTLEERLARIEARKRKYPGRMGRPKKGSMNTLAPSVTSERGECSNSKGADHDSGEKRNGE